MSIYEDDVRDESKYLDFSTHWQQDDYFFFLLDSNLCCHLTPAMYIPIQFFSARVNIISPVISVVVQHWTLIIIDNDDISLFSSTDYRIQKYVYTIMFRKNRDWNSVASKSFRSNSKREIISAIVWMSNDRENRCVLFRERLLKPEAGNFLPRWEYISTGSRTVVVKEEVLCRVDFTPSKGIKQKWILGTDAVVQLRTGRAHVCLNTHTACARKL